MINLVKWLFSREKITVTNCAISHFTPVKNACYLFKGCSFPDKENVEVLELSLIHMTNKLDELLTECTDKNGKPKQPSYKAVMQAKGCLPKQYKNSLIKNKK